MRKSGWNIVPVAFFLLINVSVSSAEILFFSRLAFFLFLVSLFLFLRQFDLKRILQPVVGGVSFIVFLYGIIQKFVLFPIYLSRISPEDNFFTQAFITRIKGGRIFSIFPLPTLYAIICTVLILFIFHYMISASKNGKQRFLWGILLLAGLVNLILTQSFGGVLYLSAGGLVYLLVSGILKVKYLVPVITVLSLFLSITIALRFSEFKELEPIKFRYSNWKQAARIIEANPLWGAGLGNYEAKIARYTFPGEARSIYAHNFFLQFTAETGIIFPLFVLLFIFLVRKKLLPDDYKEKVIYITTAVVMLLYNLIDIGLYFFSAAVISVIALSQIYPAFIKSKPEPAVRLNLRLRRIFQPSTIAVTGVLIVLSLLLGLESVSDSQRRQGDFLANTEKDHEGAARFYKKSISLNPFNFRALLNYASLPLPADKAVEAEAFLDRALALNPDSAFAHYLKSRYHFKRKHFLNALQHAAAASERDPRTHHYKTWRRMIGKSLEAGLKKQEKQGQANESANETVGPLLPEESR